VWLIKVECLIGEQNKNFKRKRMGNIFLLKKLLLPLYKTIKKLKYEKV